MSRPSGKGNFLQDSPTASVTSDATDANVTNTVDKYDFSHRNNQMCAQPQSLNNE